MIMGQSYTRKGTLHTGEEALFAYLEDVDVARVEHIKGTINVHDARTRRSGYAIGELHDPPRGGHEPAQAQQTQKLNTLVPMLLPAVC